MSAAKLIICLIAVLCFNTLSAQEQALYHKLKDRLYYSYDGPTQLLESISVGVNTASFIFGGAGELAAEFRPNRFASICFTNGFTRSSASPVKADNYKSSGTFIKLGVRNYLLNSFFPSRLDVFSGLYYIGSDIAEDYREFGNAEVKSYDNFNSFAALQTGISYRPARNITINAGAQYTFLKDRKSYPVPAEISYQPGVGRWKSVGAVEAILTIQYRLPVSLYKTVICCLNNKGEYEACTFYRQYHKCPKFL